MKINWIKSFAIVLPALLPFPLGAQSSSNVNVPTSFQGSGIDGNARNINLLLRKRMGQIRKDFKSGKLTKEQARLAFNHLKVVRQKELEFFQENKAKKIFSNQMDQLVQMLN